MKPKINSRLTKKNMTKENIQRYKHGVNFRYHGRAC